MLKKVLNINGLDRTLIVDPDAKSRRCFKGTDDADGM